MSQFQTPAVVDESKPTYHTPTYNKGGQITQLHLVGIASLDMSEGGEEGEFPANADQVHDMVGELHCYRDVTIIYEIPALGKVDELSRSYQNLRYYIDKASNLYVEDEIEKLAELLQQAYTLYEQYSEGVKFGVKYVITNNVFGLRVELEIGAPDQNVNMRKVGVFVFNPQHF